MTSDVVVLQEAHALRDCASQELTHARHPAVGSQARADPKQSVDAGEDSTRPTHGTRRG
ncbi:MAG: hypothetical protein VKK03_03410 [Synechococcus sp.]|nr:hypothetical protein [Synechococcus sp.]